MKKRFLSTVLAFAMALSVIVIPDINVGILKPEAATAWGGRSPVAPGVAMTSGYRTAARPTHNGLDFSGQGDRNIYAVKEGTVVYVYNGCTHQNAASGCCNTGTGYGSYGNVVVIRHSDGIHSMYAHIAKNTINVSVNQSVSKGQVLATMGNTGNSSGIHLHLEMRTTANNQNTHMNPLTYIDLNDFNNGGGNPPGNYFPIPPSGHGGSIVNALNSIGVDSSYSYRALIAQANNISNYTGTPEQNTTMLNMLMAGILKRP